ncbi:unnamed protein product [Nippostrongylus brasiliensis]|uniref:Secreted protein n=1 Tax=Nippostrongylus brasiliensis TaxID=27835 RepID=A0A0N4YKK9_NIPBR|nr:unnamed protein product [Nippostrongylus brasiliensis]
MLQVAVLVLLVAHANADFDLGQIVQQIKGGAKEVVDFLSLVLSLIDSDIDELANETADNSTTAEGSGTTSPAPEDSGTTPAESDTGSA